MALPRFPGHLRIRERWRRTGRRAARQTAVWRTSRQRFRSAMASPTFACSFFGRRSNSAFSASLQSRKCSSVSLRRVRRKLASLREGGSKRVPGLRPIPGVMTSAVNTAHQLRSESPPKRAFRARDRCGTCRLRPPRRPGAQQTGGRASAVCVRKLLRDWQISRRPGGGAARTIRGERVGLWEDWLPGSRPSFTAAVTGTARSPR